MRKVLVIVSVIVACCWGVAEGQLLSNGWVVDVSEKYLTLNSGGETEKKFTIDRVLTVVLNASCKKTT